MEKENLKEQENRNDRDNRGDRGDRSKGKSSKFDKVDKEFDQKIIEVARVTRVTEGGKRLRFRACVVVGNKKGKVGIGLGKSGDVAQAVDKAALQAKKNMIDVTFSTYTVPCEVVSKFKSAKVLLKPATEGTNIVAGGPIRSLLELAGIQNVVAKTLGSTKNKINNAYAALKALEQLKIYETVREEKFKDKKKTEIKELKEAIKK